MTFLWIGLFVAAVILIIAVFYFKRQPSHKVHTNSEIECYVGKVFTLEFPVINGTGILQVDHTTLRIQCPDLPAGSRIKIARAEGMVLIAEPNHT